MNKHQMGVKLLLASALQHVNGIWFDADNFLFRKEAAKKSKSYRDSFWEMRFAYNLKLSQYHGMPQNILHVSVN